MESEDSKRSDFASMERTDSHTHTLLSRHGRGTVAEVIDAAAHLGLTTIALTEHLPLPDWVDDGTFAMEASRMDEYLSDIEAARLAHPELEIITGIEVDWRYGAEEYILDWLSRYSFELVLGSVHMLSYPDGSHWEFDHPLYADGWTIRSEEGVWREYLELWLQAVKSAVPFNVMTHPDLPKVLNHKPTFDTTDYYQTMVDAVAASGAMIELNTAGLRKPVGEVYPAHDLLAGFCNAGVPCTVSSDAHTPEDVGRDLDIAYAAMRAAGYSFVTVPMRNGQRRQIPLG